MNGLTYNMGVYIKENKKGIYSMDVIQIKNNLYIIIEISDEEFKLYISPSRENPYPINPILSNENRLDFIQYIYVYQYWIDAMQTMNSSIVKISSNFIYQLDRKNKKTYRITFKNTENEFIKLDLSDLYGIID